MTGDPLLYLHGLAGDLHAPFTQAEGTPLLRALGEGFDVTAPPHPGYDGTPIDGLGHVEDWAFHYVDLLDSLGLGEIDVIGHSIGGWLAAELAVRHPHRVRRLALVAPVGLHAPEHAGALFFGAVAPRGLGGFGEARALLFADPESEAALTTLPDDMDTERQQRWFGGLIGAARLGWDAPQLANPKLASHLHRVSAPVLLVWGDQDRVVPVAQADAWQAGLSDSRLEIVQGAGHCVVMEQPDAVAAAVLGFLDNRSGGVGSA